MNKKQLELSNGETIYYLDEGNNSNVLVLLHGNMSSSMHYLPIISELSAKFRVIAPDMRGFGDSTYNNRINNLEELGYDVMDLLNQLDIQEFSVAGWSTGGAVAMSIASTELKRVSKLILIESCSHKGYPIFKKDELGAPILGEYYHTVEELAEEPVQVKPMLDVMDTGNVAVMKVIWDSAIYTVNKPNEKDEEIYLQETMKQRNLLDIDWCLTTFNMSNEHNGLTMGDNSIKNIICPVLSIWGDKDVVVLEYMIDETIADLNDVRKIKFESSGHSPLVDCPELLVKDISYFILH